MPKISSSFIDLNYDGFPGPGRPPLHARLSDMWKQKGNISVFLRIPIDEREINSFENQERPLS
jgi:hypothetical protein